MKYWRPDRRFEIRDAIAAPARLLVVGAGSRLGHLTVEEAARAGFTVRALVPNSRHEPFSATVEVEVGDLTSPGSLTEGVSEVDAVAFVHASDSSDKAEHENIDYGGVRNVLAAPGARRARIVLMTSADVTNRSGVYNQATEANDWKRRAERLVRASRLPYTIVRPGRLDGHAPDRHRLLFRQDGKRRATATEDCPISRRQVARVLVWSLRSEYALRKTFEVFASEGRTQENLDPLFASLRADPEQGFDGLFDPANQPLAEEPQRVRDELLAAESRVLRAEV